MDLAEWATGANLRALDVCAGCGVMGFELLEALKTKLFQTKRFARFDFLELQPDFATHFEANRKITATSNAHFIADSYCVLQTDTYSQMYDLIIANPPYFQKGEGTLSANDINNRARFFLDDNANILLKGIRNALKVGARAYVLMKSGKKHGRDAFTSARVELFDCLVERFADVRGTDLIRITRLEI